MYNYILQLNYDFHSSCKHKCVVSYILEILKLILFACMFSTLYIQNYEFKVNSTAPAAEAYFMSMNFMQLSRGIITLVNNSYLRIYSTLLFVHIISCSIMQLYASFQFTVVSTPSINLTVPNTQIVGQSLTLECSVTIVRGITSRVDIVWSNDGVELQRTNGTNASLSSDFSTMYTSTYTIPLLSTVDDSRVYQCKVVIDTNPPVMVTGSVTLNVTVPTPTVSITPSDPIQGAMVGSPQDIQCTVSTVSGVELNSVMISWMGPGGDTITNDSRVTISPTSGSGNNYTSSLQFMYLMEGDEGTYECNVMILETNISDSVELNTLISKLFIVRTCTICYMTGFNMA